MPGKARNLGGPHNGRRRARYRALTVAALALAVLARSAPSDAATIAHQVSTSPGPRNGHGTELVVGTELKGGSWLASSDGHYRLAMQGDGNLVLSWEGHPLWASNTAKHPGAFLAMQADGDLVVYQGDRPIWSSGTDHGGNGRYYLSLQDNGNAMIYSAARKSVWATNTAVLGLQLGDMGPAVMALQMYLSSLGYWVGVPDGTFGDSTQQAVWALQKAAGLSADGVVGPKTAAALEAGVVPKPRSTSGYVVEVDLQDDLLMVINAGKLLHTLNVSTGGGYTYTDQGVTSVAITPSGVFHIYNVINGLDVDSLGELWRPRFFVGGFAVHGESYVPPFPVSHGCVRVSDEAINWIWAANIMPIGTEVWVNTFRVSLPRIADTPRRPCEAITTRSQSCFFAVSTILSIRR